MPDPVNEDRPVTQAELADLRAALADLQRENQELRDARTAEERREAQAGVREAKADLDAVAASLGISRETLEKATAEAKRAERRDELRPIMQELYAELREEERKAEEKRLADEAEAKRKPKGAKPAAEKPDPAADPDANGRDPDDGPTAEHWSERGLGSLIR